MLAINGLGGSSMRKEFMSKDNLDWDMLKRILQSRSVARNTREMGVALSREG